MAPQLARKAQELATYVARKLDVHGVLAVEMFLLTDGRLVVTEIVPAPHPAFLAAEVAGATGQLEQLVRAIAGLPLGSTSVARPAAAVPIHRNRLGPRAEPDVQRALEVPGTRAFLYGPSGHTPGDAPIGHLYAVGETSDDAVARAALARARLTLDPARPGVTRRRRSRLGRRS
jgi:5-(carboxyamino)imidazole ribonucleotide synthase